MRKIFETPNRNLAQKKNQRSVAEKHAHHLLLLKCSTTEMTNEISKDQEAAESSRLEYEANIRNNFRDINNNLDQIEEWHQRSVAEPFHHKLQLQNSSRKKPTRQLGVKKHDLKVA